MPIPHRPSLAQRVDESQGDKRALQVLVCLRWRDYTPHVCEI